MMKGYYQMMEFINAFGVTLVMLLTIGYIVLTYCQ